MKQSCLVSESNDSSVSAFHLINKDLINPPFTCLRLNANKYLNHQFQRIPKKFERMRNSVYKISLSLFFEDRYKAEM